MAKKVAKQKAVVPAKPKAPVLKPLSIIERTFLEHYIATGFNGGEACRRMGIKGKEGGNDDSNPRTRAYGFLKRTHVQQHLELMRAKLANRFPNMLEKAIRTYDDILEFDRRDLKHPDGRWKDLHEMTYAEASCVKKIKCDRRGRVIEVEFEGKMRAADSVIDRLRPQADKLDGTPGATGIAPTPTVVVINVQGQPLPQSYKVLTLEEQGIKEEG